MKLYEILEHVSWQQTKESLEINFPIHASEKEDYYYRFKSIFRLLFIKPKKSDDVLTIGFFGDDSINYSMRPHLHRKEEVEFSEKHCKTMARMPDLVIGMNVDDITCENYSPAEIVAYTILEFAYCSDYWLCYYQQ